MGPTNERASATLFDVEVAEARAFGDDRVVLVCRDEEGNEVQAALFPAEAREIREGIEALAADSAVFE